jgi:hypothetical protein
MSAEIRLVKKGLGIDKASRDKDKGSSLAEYIENLGRRAKEFGIHREAQTQKALILFHEIAAKVQLHKNCDEIEQRDLKCTEKDVIDWLWNYAIPEFKKVDKKFKETQQRYWVREL